jgi:hypothetical protein
LDGRLPAVAEAVASLAADARAGELDSDAALAAFTAVRTLSAEMERCELALLDALHGAGVPWSQVAAAMGSPRRQAAQKRRSDLAARYAPGSPPDVGEATAEAPLPPADSETEAGAEAPRPRTDEELARSLRHHPVPGLGAEWTFAEPSESSGDVILWWNKATRAGGARHAWPKKGWEPTGPRFWTGIGPAQSSRAKALRYAAEKFEHKRRKETPAGPDVPLPGLPGWALRQTLDEKDRRAWRVIAPDGAVAGSVFPAWGGRYWSASLGDPAREFYHPVAVYPWEPGTAAGDGSDWRTRDAAAYGVAAEHDESLPSPAEALARAAAERQRRKEERDAGESA